MSHAHRHHGAERVVTGSTPHASAEMNVTPLIDVLLVLLVIFMATLPLNQRGVDINLPLETSTSPQTADILTQIVAEYTADHQLLVNKQPVQIANAETFLRDTFETRKDKTLFIIGAGSVRYGEIMAVIDAAMGAGVTKVGIVTEGMREEAMHGGSSGGK
jgi:biopolymer transport protein TolR